MVTTNSHGTNSKIVFKILPEKYMRDIGFTDYAPENWYYCRMLKSNISFNVTIPKDRSEAWVDVLDEDFCQPYDYQAILSNAPTHTFANKIKILVEKEMIKLCESGIIENYKVGDYI